MRVAVVFYDIVPEGGGAFTFGRSLFRALRTLESETGHRFVYYATSGAGSEPGVLRIPIGRGFIGQRALRRATRRYRETERLGAHRLPSFPTWFEQSILEHDIDLVWWATNYAEECDLPFIFTILDLEYLRQPWFPEVSEDGEWPWTSRHRYFSRFIPRATRIIVPNEAGREQALRNFPVDPDRFLLLHHPTPEFALEGAAMPASPVVLEANGIKKPYLLFPAQFWAHKNHATLFEALAELNRDSDEVFELVCVGSDKGQLNQAKTVAKELGIAEAVHFLGFVGIPELVALYQNAFALTYLSLFGPENLPPVEAMALGCPVVAADVPGAREQLGDAALIVPGTDSDAVVAAVRELGDPAIRKRLVEAGRERARQFTATDYVRGVIEFLDSFERTRRSWQ
jgi:glycosyltransferase involved in cell wall biosynthesis